MKRTTDTDPAKPRPRTAQRMARTRQRLLDVARELFIENGIHATRIEDITGRADIGKGAFYNYFESKEAIVAALLEGGIEILEREYLAPLEQVPRLDERLSRLVDAHETFLDRHPEYALLLHQSRGIMLVKKSKAEVLRVVLTRYLDCIGRHIVPGESGIPGHEVMELAAAFAGIIAGHRSFLISTGASPDPSTVREVLSVGLGPVIASRLSR